MPLFSPNITSEDCLYLKYVPNACCCCFARRHLSPFQVCFRPPTPQTCQWWCSSTVVASSPGARALACTMLGTSPTRYVDGHRDLRVDEACTLTWTKDMAVVDAFVITVANRGRHHQLPLGRIRLPLYRAFSRQLWFVTSRLFRSCEDIAMALEKGGWVISPCATFKFMCK